MARQSIKLPPPPGGAVDVLVIAGEHSGDQHAALVVRELLADHPDWRVTAVGGPSLQRAGSQLLYDLTGASVVGLVEVLRHYGLFKALFEGLLDWVDRFRPKVVVLVDYPGFNLRFATALARRGLSRKGGGKVLVYQYVSPQIWAWKAKRRFKMAQILDEIGVIFPFEIECYADTDLPVHFVGHPFARPDYRNPLDYDPDGPFLFLPGSRQQAIGRIFPVMLQAMMQYQREGGNRKCICLYPEEGIQVLISGLISRSGLNPGLIEMRPVEAGARVCGVLTSSGTMSLNCALAGIPGAVVYRAHPLTALIGRRLINIEWLGIANLILGREQYPEYLQSRANPTLLAEKLVEFESDTGQREQFQKAAAELLANLSTESSDSVAKRITQQLND